MCNPSDLHSMATLIGLCIRVKLLRSLPSRFKVVVRIAPGTHSSEVAGAPSLELVLYFQLPVKKIIFEFLSPEFRAWHAGNPPSLTLLISWKFLMGDLRVIRSTALGTSFVEFGPVPLATLFFLAMLCAYSAVYLFTFLDRFRIDETRYFENDKVKCNAYLRAF